MLSTKFFFFPFFCPYHFHSNFKMCHFVGDWPKVLTFLKRFQKVWNVFKKVLKRFEMKIFETFSNERAFVTRGYREETTAVHLHFTKSKVYALKKPFCAKRWRFRWYSGFAKVAYTSVVVKHLLCTIFFLNVCIATFRKRKWNFERIARCCTISA